MKNVSVLCIVRFYFHSTDIMHQLFRKLSKASVSRLSNETSSKVKSGRGLMLSTAEKKNNFKS